MFYNILIAGVGGQGSVLIGSLLREYGLKSPIIRNVVGTETRGVSQREGSVTATVRYLIDSQIYSADQDYKTDDLISPNIPINDAHLVLGLEPLETLRNLKYIAEPSVVILNTHQYFPRNVIIGSEKEKKYPSMVEIIETLNKFARKVLARDFNELAKVQLGSPIYANSIVLGAALKEYSDIFDKKIIIDLMCEHMANPTENVKAFELGYEIND